jgi:hypothetical protein
MLIVDETVVAIYNASQSMPLRCCNSSWPIKFRPFKCFQGTPYEVHFFMSYGVLSFLVRLFYFFRFIKISNAVGASHQPLARSSSLSDIPERNLTQYVRLLMGTEAGGHSNSPEVTFLIYFHSVRRIYNSIRNGKGSGRQFQ